MEFLSTIYLNVLIEFLLILVLFSDNMTKSRIRFYVGTFLSLFSIFILMLVPSRQIFLYIDVIVGCATVILLLEEKVYEKITSFLLGYMLTSLLYQTLALIFDLTFRLPVFIEMDDVKEKNEIKIFLVFLLVIFLFAKTKMQYRFQLTFVNKLFLCVYTSIICIVLTLFHLNREAMDENFLKLFAILCIALTCIIVNHIISLSAQNLNLKYLREQRQYTNMLKDYYNETKKNNTEIRKLKHDIKNHINILGNLIDIGQFDDASLYINEINNYVSQRTATIPDTGNVLLNAILLQKKYEFPKITLIFKGIIHRDIPINDYDFCTILNNLLDNAFEYSMENNFSSVEVCICQEASSFMIKVTNDLISKIDIKKFKKTTKRNNCDHGYGIIIVRETAARYNGFLNYIEKNNQLIATVQVFF